MLFNVPEEPMTLEKFVSPKKLRVWFWGPLVFLSVMTSLGVVMSIQFGLSIQVGSLLLPVILLVGPLIWAFFIVYARRVHVLKRHMLAYEGRIFGSQEAQALVQLNEQYESHQLEPASQTIKKVYDSNDLEAKKLLKVLGVATSSSVVIGGVCGLVILSNPGGFVHEITALIGIVCLFVLMIGGFIVALLLFANIPHYIKARRAIRQQTDQKEVVARLLTTQKAQHGGLSIAPSGEGGQLSSVTETGAISSSD